MKHDMLTYFIHERVAMAVRRNQGQEPPWTEDAILRQYRFCNVYREWDPVTRFIKDWLGESTDHLEARAALARYINNPLTLEAIGSCSQWNEQQVLSELKVHREQGHRVFNPAYIVSTNGIAMDKLEYVVQLVTRVHEQVHLSGDETLAEAAKMFQAVRGVGGFMAGQIIGDLKHKEVLLPAEDWMTWCIPGPGSQRGLNRVLDKPLSKKWNVNDFIEEISILCDTLLPVLKVPHSIDAQNMQNCLCEFDKYVRAIEGGRPKQNYVPSGAKIGN